MYVGKNKEGYSVLSSFMKEKGVDEVEIEDLLVYLKEYDSQSVSYKKLYAEALELLSEDSQKLMEKKKKEFTNFSHVCKPNVKVG